MNDNYIKLIDFSLGKYKYTVMRNNSKILYFEIVNNKYVKPIISFDLYDNEGKSLTSVNQHFFMSQLVNRVNVAFKKGFLVSDQEIFEYLTKVKNTVESDINVKKLFKGSYMSEINESNFESNKRSISNYLDNFKYDTFVDYNNVAIFDGSLEKNSDDVSTISSDFKTEEVQEDILDDIDIQDETVDNLQTFDSSTDLNVKMDVVDNSSNNMNIDFDNIPVDNSLGEYLSSSDYFSNLSSNNQNVDSSMNSQNVDQLVDVNQNIIEPINDVQGVDTSMNSQNVDQLADVNQNLVEPINDVQGVDTSMKSQNVYNVQDLNNDIDNSNINVSNDLNTEKYFDYSVESGISSSLVDEGNVAQNDIQENVNSSVQNIDNVQLSDNISVDSNNVNNSSSFGVDYIDQVKSRIENSNNVELGTLDSDLSDIDKTLISDKLDLPELDDVNNDLSGSIPKKKSTGVVIFIIILLVLLALFTFFLYNYVF